MSAETETPLESVAWCGLTYGLTWVAFGVLGLSGLVSGVLLTNIYFLGLLGVVVLVQLMLDMWQQNREFNVIFAAFIFGMISVSFMLLGYVSLSVVVLGIFLYVFAALVAEGIIEYAFKK